MPMGRRERERERERKTNGDKPCKMNRWLLKNEVRLEQNRIKKKGKGGKYTKQRKNPHPLKFFF